MPIYPHLIVNIRLEDLFFIINEKTAISMDKLITASKTNE